MSQKLVNLNTDLSLLRSEGYDVSVSSSGRLIIRDVPYVNSNREVKRGIIVSDLDLAGELTVPPKSHVAFFVGDYPCDTNGAALPGISQNSNQPFGDGFTPNHQMSRKPTLAAYPNYYDKIKTYIAIVCSPAQALDPTVSAQTHPVVVPDEGESVFNYIDTASTKSGIVEANKRFDGLKIAIVGVGGTGSYVLDLVSKTPVQEIHLFDSDTFLNHNAFRCPGAASLTDLNSKSLKVEYLKSVYSKMRTHVVAHNCNVDESTVDGLRGMSFVFVCIDKGSSKKTIIERLEEWGLPFIDVGMGINVGEDNNKIAGTVTVTTSTAQKRDHFRQRVALLDGVAEHDYSRNVQIADVNALGAALAVIKWKKTLGYYHDLNSEHFCHYTLRTNHLSSEYLNEG